MDPSSELCGNWPEAGMISLVVEDNAPIHRSHLSQSARLAANINLLPHPANSPDLNPIKHIWHIAKKLVSRIPKASNIEQLKEQIKTAWEEIPMEVVNTIVGSMDERVDAIEQNKGWHTRF